MVSEWREIDEGRLPAVAVGASSVPCKLTSWPVRIASRRFRPVARVAPDGTMPASRFRARR
jgi:hypothetical protein